MVPGHAVRMHEKALGVSADEVVFDLEEGPVALTDSHGETRVGRQRLVPRTVVRAGRVYREPGGRSAPHVHQHGHHHHG